jgi:hypothetical protein
VAPTLDQIKVAIEPARWALLTRAATAGGFAAAAAEHVLAAAGITVTYKNARNRAERLEKANLLQRLPKTPLYYAPTTDGRLIQTALSALITGSSGPAPPGTRLLGLVAMADSDDLEVLLAGPEGADIAEELRIRIEKAPWAQRGALRVSFTD